MHFFINIIPFVACMVFCAVMLYLESRESKAEKKESKIFVPDRKLILAREVIHYPNGQTMTIFQAKSTENYDVLKHNQEEIEDIKQYHQLLLCQGVKINGHPITLEQAAMQWVDMCAASWHHHEYDCVPDISFM